MRILPAVPAIVLLLSAICGLGAAEEPDRLNDKTYWFGNSLPGGKGDDAHWMMMGVDDLALAGDRLYPIVDWDERGGETNIYSTDGAHIFKPEGWHAWGWQGGPAVAVDAQYVYYSVGHNQNDGGGKNFSGVARYTRDGKPAPFAGAEYGHRLLVNLDHDHKPTGVAVADGELFVADPLGDRIVVYATADLHQVREFPCAHPGRIVVDATPEKALWVIDTKANAVRRLGRDGKDLGVRIADCLKPVAMAVTPEGDLLVADGDPTRQRIQRYKGASGTRIVGADFGSPIYQGATPGAVAPGKFFRITGLACGVDGSLYVASWDYGGKIWKFDAKRKLVWVRAGTEFVNCADADPTDDTSIYSTGHRYVIDYAKPPGESWRDAAITLDPVRFPDDARLRVDRGMAMRLLRLGGKKVMFGKHQMDSAVYAWRFDGEIAVPAAIYCPTSVRMEGEPAQGFSARWTGWLTAPTAGRYRISAISDDGVRVTLDGKRIIDHWDAHGAVEDIAEVELAAGARVPIVVEYYQGGGGCSLSLGWSLPGQPRTIIPATALSGDADGRVRGLNAEFFRGGDLRDSAQKRIDATIDYPQFTGDPASPEFGAPKFTGWPAGRPSGPYLWIDRNGDGAAQADEYQPCAPGSQAVRIDDRGDIVVNTGGWDAGKGAITIIPCTGVDARGVPEWDLAKQRSTLIPTDGGLQQLSKLSYDVANDRMYIGAWTDTHPFPGGGWEQMTTGAELLRFDHWSTKPEFVWRSVVMPPGGMLKGTPSPKAWSFEQDYAFIAYSWQFERLAVDVYDLRTGKRVGRLLPTEEVGSTTGWIDMNDAVQSHQRADGTYVVFAEEVWMAKGLYWLWKPSAR